MTRARGRVLFIAGLFSIAAIALTVALWRGQPKHVPPRPATDRPTLLLLTSLPLVFGDDFSLEQAGSPALKALETRYRVVPISVTDPAELAKGRLLLMAQPQGQAPEDLVALDQWVRGGGRVLLLADPMLEWPSKRPLGDPLRPPPVFTDTGLLGHWGLRFDAPDERGARSKKLGGYKVTAVSPGELAGGCDISGSFVAHCRIAKGRATVVADADLLNSASLGLDAEWNLDGLLSELAQLEQP